MDPLTLVLIGAGLFAATRIKKAATPPQVAAPEAPPEGAGEGTFYGIPPHAFGGRGLRPAVTHREVSKERNIEGAEERGGRRGRGLGEEPADIAIAANFRAQQAIASGGPGDVVGQAGQYTPARPSGTSTGTFGLIGTTPFGPSLGGTSSSGFGLGGRSGIGSRY